MDKVPERLKQQINFIMEIDKLKHIYRQNLVVDGSRRENDVEHSWHLAVMAMLLQEYSLEPVDLIKVIKMVLLHDLVEIDAGDTFCYDPQAGLDKEERETKAADRLYSLLPSDQATELRALWEEFEAKQTAEAKFAACLDRLQPFLNNYYTEGGTWRIHDVPSHKVQKRLAEVGECAPVLGELVDLFIQDAIAQGFLREEKNGPS
ncbi:MAG: HD domain-containing protein [Firmicutes bacterium]|nr:HD domain-containing protein [Bacillota bacterium]